MKIKNSGMERDFYIFNNNRATKKFGTKSAFFVLLRRAALPTVLIRFDPHLDA
tara:strand:+ start:250 stop:408 length:159 start_codon:yes stop_codon:yes gene_type:complete